MTLMKYHEPFKALEDLHEEINRLFGVSAGRGLATREDIFAPSIDISEDKDNIYVEADLPGFDQKDIKVNTKGSTLTISAKHDEKKEEKNKNYHRIERVQGSFFRQVILPSTVESARVKATYKNGVLKLALPKKEEEKGKEVKIENE